MPEGYQTSYLRSAGLFNARVLAQFLDDKRTSLIPNSESRLRALSQWVGTLPAKGQHSKEGSLEQGFNQKILVETLGYSLYPSHDATAWAKAPSDVTGIAGEPDVILGDFTKGSDPSISIVVELKPPGTPFDAPQSRPGRKTPAEQAFDYAESILGVRWVLVSDMRYIRLYSVESKTDFELFDLTACIDTDLKANDQFKKLFFLLHREFLIDGGRSSPTSRLLTKSLDRQLRIRDSFYGGYYEIRSDLLSAVESAANEQGTHLAREEVLEATQRLLDRMLFLYYTEDHPDRLIPPETVKTVTEAARRLPGSNPHRVYDSLKALFAEVDQGSPLTSGIRISAYNGELFKRHSIIDEINLPDTLHDKLYHVREPDGHFRTIEGVWGLHGFDFWQELNEHLLGHIFEESLSDIPALVASEQPQLSDKLAQRRRWGIYYTNQILSDFLVTNALRDILQEHAARHERDGFSAGDALDAQLQRLATLRIVDFACGSGAFLVSSYRELYSEHARLSAALQELRRASDASQLDLDSFDQSLHLARLLRQSLYGADLLPQAVEIAKLALWLRSARKGERVADLSQNIVVADSLNVADVLSKMNSAPATFDLVVGNPPWGGEVNPETYASVCESLSLPAQPKWDSWELFLALAMYALRDGGRLALVLPDTIFSPDKRRIRQLLLENTAVERLHNLGPDWFGKNVRMATVVLQARKGARLVPSDITSVLLTGSLRRQAIRGELQLRQIEARLARSIPQERCRQAPDYAIEIFRSRLDDEIIARIDSNSRPLSSLCQRARGEEMSKTGLLWECPSCLRLTTPGSKKKGGGYEPKGCPICGLTLTNDTVRSAHLVLAPSDPSSIASAPYVDGDDISHRYMRVQPKKRIRLDVVGWPYKDARLYQPPKILIRQAGVGLCAVLDETEARCPQSVYIYRIKPEWLEKGYSHEFLLGCLLSRTMAYYVFKRFAEVDPARPHAKLTHARLEALPIPSVDFGSARASKAYETIVQGVAPLLSGNARIGGSEDLAIESALRELWALSPEDGAAINKELSQLPSSQALRELFSSVVGVSAQPRP